MTIKTEDLSPAYQSLARENDRLLSIINARRQDCQAMTNDKTVTMSRDVLIRVLDDAVYIKQEDRKAIRNAIAAPIVEADGTGEAVALQSQPAAIVDRKAICFLRLTDYGLTLPDGALLYASPPAPVALNARMAGILQSLRTNANPALFAPGQLAEVDACLDKVKEMNR